MSAAGKKSKFLSVMLLPFCVPALCPTTKSYTLLYTRELDEAGRADFLARLNDFHARNRSKSEPASALRAELKKYVRACNPDMNPASETAVFERLGSRGA